MITEADFTREGDMNTFCFTLQKLDRLCGGYAEMWKAYFDPQGMDHNVRRLFENSVHPAALTCAVTTREYLEFTHERAVEENVRLRAAIGQMLQCLRAAQENQHVPWSEMERIENLAKELGL